MKRKKTTERIVTWQINDKQKATTISNINILTQNKKPISSQNFLKVSVQGVKC